jgi:hypothetical protein
MTDEDNDETEVEDNDETEVEDNDETEVEYYNEEQLRDTLARLANNVLAIRRSIAFNRAVRYQTRRRTLYLAEHDDMLQRKLDEMFMWQNLLDRILLGEE